MEERERGEHTHPVHQRKTPHWGLNSLGGASLRQKPSFRNAIISKLLDPKILRSMGIHKWAGFPSIRFYTSVPRKYSLLYWS